MRIAIFGTGGVGGYFGGRLAEAGFDTVFVARGKHLEAIRKDGLKVKSINGDFIIKPVQAADNPSDIGIVDIILVTVKAWQVSDAAQAMRPMIGPETFVISLENGVEAPIQLSKIIGEKHVLGGLCHIISYITKPGHICHAGIYPSIQFGELNNEHSERVKTLLRIFEQTKGVKATVPSNIQIAMWSKFLFIASLSGIGAVTRVPIGIFRSLPETRSMLTQAMQEILDVAHAHNIALPQDSVNKTLAFIDDLPQEGTASMQRDIMNGRPSELESQNGAVVRLGEEAAVATPVNSFIYSSLLPLELHARGKVKFDI